MPTQINTRAARSLMGSKDYRCGGIPRPAGSSADAFVKCDRVNLISWDVAAAGVSPRRRSTPE